MFGISATMRRTLGDDVEGACGMLRNKNLNQTTQTSTSKLDSVDSTKFESNRLAKLSNNNQSRKTNLSDKKQKSTKNNIVDKNQSSSKANKFGYENKTNKSSSNKGRVNDKNFSKTTKTNNKPQKNNQKVTKRTK